jgi:hypothetical protein
LYFHIPLLSFVQDKIETLNIEKMLEEKNDNLQADGYVVSNSTESIQVETTTPETTAISDATENNITETAVLAEQYVTTTDAVTENVNQKALSSIEIPMPRKVRTKP